MEFALLGPLEVRRDGELLAVRRGRSRVVLISLLLRAGQVVPAEVLVDQAWGDRLPADAANSLQVHVSYLRRVLGRAPGDEEVELRTVGAGYMLRVPPASIDLHRFEQGVSSAAARLRNPSPGDAEAAIRELAAALALWRGEPLQDVAYEPFAVAEVERLHELRAAALEHQVDARLLLGDHEHVVPVLHQLVADHPLREHLRAQLMLALYRCGRQADALRAFDATRAHLVDELGVDPGPELQRLHRAVLAQDPELDWAPRDPPVPTGVGGSEAPAASPPTRLPAPTSRLIGRDQELARIGELLADNRMVTLTGPGGIGKTRLALAVAHTAADARPVWLVELAEIDDPAVVPYEVARAVGVSHAADPIEALRARVGAAAGLLVLDTCEHVLDACAETAHRLLRGCPALHVLATSRQRLAVPGEVAWPLRPLALPAVDDSPEEVAGAAAVRLFVERSRAVRPDFELGASEAEIVARICRLLDGLPLAIELAAARVAMLSPDGILRRLDDRFSLLSRVGRAADVRQRSLRAAIAWSFDLLDGEQQAFLGRLGVFAGGFTYDAAVHVAADGLSTHPLDLLGSMVDRSLVIVDGDDSYRLLDSLRAFAIECLSRDLSERGAANHRLARWLAASCEAAERDLRGPSQQATLDRLRAEVPNLRAALTWAFAVGDPMLGARLACSLVWFWALEGANEEANRWLQQALLIPGLPDDVRARVLEGIGINRLVLGATADAQRALQESVELWSRIAPERGVVALIYLGVTHRWLGRLDEAIATYDRAIVIGRQQHDDWPLAWALLWRSRAAIVQRQDALADRLLAEAEAAAERVGDRRILGWIILERGLQRLRHGDPAQAAASISEAVAIHDAAGWAPALSAALSGLGRAVGRLGSADAARAHHRRALHIALQLGQRFGIAEALEAQADTAAAIGDDVEAVQLLAVADTLRAQLANGRLPPAERGRDVTVLEAALRTRLGDRDFAAAYRQGQDRTPGDFA